MTKALTLTENPKKQRYNTKTPLKLQLHNECAPMGTPGVMSRMYPPYPHACRKRRLKWGGFSEQPLKGGSRVGAWTGTLKNPTKCIWRLEPDRRFNFFNPPAHLCVVTFMTEISLHVTLNNQIHSLTHSQRLRTTLGRSVVVTIATQLVWLNRLTLSKPSH